MLTDIYHRALCYTMFGHKSSDFSFVSTAGVSCTGKVSSISTNLNVSTNGTPRLTKFKAKDSYYSGVAFGSGTTPPTPQDRNLVGSELTTFSASADLVTGEENGNVYVQATYTITNTGTEDFTIGEVGLFASASTSAHYNYSVLIDRTVLDEPVTIPAGGVGKVTYRIYVTIPAA